MTSKLHTCDTPKCKKHTSSTHSDKGHSACMMTLSEVSKWKKDTGEGDEGGSPGDKRTHWNAKNGQTERQSYSNNTELNSLRLFNSETHHPPWWCSTWLLEVPEGEAGQLGEWNEVNWPDEYWGWCGGWVGFNRVLGKDSCSCVLRRNVHRPVITWS